MSLHPGARPPGKPKPAKQQAGYGDPAALARVVEEIGRLPPLVTSWEVENLRDELARGARGDAFLLQGGDCAESFDDCRAEPIAAKLKILLQMCLVLVHGTRKPVVRVGRIAGQYAKPRSADHETRGDVTLPAYRGDLVNRDAFTADDREPDPVLMLARVRARRADAQLHPRADRRRVRRSAPPRVLGRVVREGHAARRRSTSRSSSRSASRSTSCRRSPASRASAAPRRLLHESRGARAAVRAGADAHGAAPRGLVQPVDALPVDRHAHRAARRRARRVPPRHRATRSAIKIGPAMTTDVAASACSTCSTPSASPAASR